MNRNSRIFRGIYVAILATFSAFSLAQQTVDQAYEQLKKDSIWVHDSAKSRVDQEAIRNFARSSDVPLKVLVVPELGRKWRSNGKELRGNYAEWLFKNPLKMENGTMIVLTKTGIAAYNPAVPKRDLGSLGQSAAKLATKDNFTPALLSLAKSVADATKAPRTTAATTSTQPKSAGSGMPIWIPILGIGALGLGAFYFVKKGKEKARVDAIRTPLIAANEDVINGISYLDSYDGLLTNPADNEKLRHHREAANDAWSASSSNLRVITTPQQADPIRQHFETALREVNEGKNVIAAATGDTQTAFQLPASLAEVDQQRAPLFDPRPGVCYFTGQFSNDLRPVEIAINGQRRTVMASPEAIESLQSGQPPQIAGDQYQGRFMPWYRVPNYNPAYGGSQYGGFGGNSFFGDMLMFSALNNAMGGWGNHGNTTVINNYGNENSTFDTGGNFDSSDTGSFDTGGSFDFGGGDSGGGDSGGGDFGGSFDS